MLCSYAYIMYSAFQLWMNYENGNNDYVLLWTNYNLWWWVMFLLLFQFHGYVTIFLHVSHCYVQAMSFCSGLCSNYEMYSLPLIHKSERINRLFNPQDHLEQGGAFWRPQRAGAGTPWRRLSRRASGARSRWGGSGRKWRRENCQWYRRRGGRADSCK